MVLSSLSNTAVEDVCAAASGSVWFQLYVYRDRGATAALVARAEAAGARAIVLTVDAPIFGRRDPDSRGYFGEFGGRYVPETLMAPVDELTNILDRSKLDQPPPLPKRGNRKK